MDIDEYGNMVQKNILAITGTYYEEEYCNY